MPARNAELSRSVICRRRARMVSPNPVVACLLGRAAHVSRFRQTARWAVTNRQRRSPVRITKFTHSCVRVDGQGVLVVDPGAFSERSALTSADAVLITHEHIDHLDVDALAEAVRERPGLRVFAHADVRPKL